MEWTTRFVVALVVLGALAGASTPAAAQSDETIVTMTIEVVNPSSNQVLGGVDLVATWEDGGRAEATTASNGKAFIDVPEAATVEVVVDDDQYTRNEPYRIQVAVEREYTIDAYGQADLDVVVEDAEGPVEDARVVLSQDDDIVVSGLTTESGLFRSGTIAQGEYDLRVVRPGYYATTRAVIVAGSPEETVTIERGRVDYDIVVEDPYFDPAEGVTAATVRVDGVGQFETDSRGATAALLPVNSDVTIETTKPGYETATRTISVDESEGSVVLSISREPALSLSALNQRIVVGEVVPVEVTNAYGEPAADVAILVDGEVVTRTDDDGRATVPIQEAGERTLQARRGSTTSESVTIQGIGEGSGESTTTAPETDTPAEQSATTEASGSGFAPGSILEALGPVFSIVALGVALVALVAVLVLALLYRRRSSGSSDDDWTDGEGVDISGGGGGGGGGSSEATDEFGGSDDGAEIPPDEGTATPVTEESGAGSTDGESGAEPADENADGDAETSADADADADVDADADAAGDDEDRPS